MLCTSRWLVVLFFLCPFTPRIRADAPAPEALVELRVSARLDGGLEVGVGPETALRERDELRLELLARGNAHVHVLHVSPSGVATLLYSSDDHQPLRVNERLKLPLKGMRPYKLDAETGRELIAVIASQRGLAEISQSHAELVRMVRSERKLPPGMTLSETGYGARSRPPHRMTRARGALDTEGPLRGDRGAKPLPIFAVPGIDGVAVATFALQHVARN